VRTNLTVDDLGDMLSLPIVGTLATYRKSGDVLLSGPKTPDDAKIGVRIEGTIRAWDFAD